MLMPAVQSSREAARGSTCANNVRQLGIAALAHLDQHRFFPTGGWGWLWVGDPDRGFGDRQPGGWVYNLLPYLEQTALHELGAGRPAAEKKAAALTLTQTPFLSSATAPFAPSITRSTVWRSVASAIAPTA
jgi:hypothetical protein